MSDSEITAQKRCAGLVVHVQQFVRFAELDQLKTYQQPPKGACEP